MSLIHALVARGTTVLAESVTGTAELKPGELIIVRAESIPDQELMYSCANYDSFQDSAK